MTSLGPRPPAAEGDAETCTGLSQPRRRLSRTSHALGEGRLPGGEESSTPEPRANPPPPDYRLPEGMAVASPR